jgi:phosphoglycolate phosphatase
VKKIKLKDVEGIVFDFDGTLAEIKIDFPAIYIKVHELIKEYGVDATELKEVYLIELITEVAEIVGGEAGAKFHGAATNLVVSEELLSAKESSLFEGVRELISELKEMNIKVGIVTRNCAEAVSMVYPEIEQEVDVFLPRDAVKFIKPNPQHLKGALSVLGIDGGRAVMVGDHPIDIISAYKVGMFPVGVLTGNSTEAELTDAGAKIVLPSAMDLLNHYY